MTKHVGACLAISFVHPPCQIFAQTGLADRMAERRADRPLRTAHHQSPDWRIVTPVVRLLPLPFDLRKRLAVHSFH